MNEINKPTAIKNFGQADEATLCCDAPYSVGDGGFYCKKCYRIVTEGVNAAGEHQFYL